MCCMNVYAIKLVYTAPIALPSVYTLLFSIEKTNVERLRVHRILTENKNDLVFLD